MQIRKAQPTDWAQMWPIFQSVVAPGDTYVFSPQTSNDTARSYWFGEGITTYVAVDGEQLLGMYKLIPNRPDLGSHIANASFMVSPESRGKGVGRALGEHCLNEARKAGYLAMQFNFVVSTNTKAVELWKRLGFEIVGTLPGAFNHKQLGYVDAYVMFRRLDDA